jgi:acyl carrier protein
MNSTETKLLETIQQELRVAPGEVTLDTLLSDLGASLDWVSVVTAVEDAFGLRIDETQSRKLIVVRDLLALVEAASRATAGASPRMSAGLYENACESSEDSAMGAAHRGRPEKASDRTRTAPGRPKPLEKLRPER